MLREPQFLAGSSDLVLSGRNSIRSPFAANALNKAPEGLTFDDLRLTGATLLT